jgi:hypothetical protein
MRKTIAVDCDGTMAKYYGREGVDYIPEKVGPPVPRMVYRIKAWLNAGIEVVILTARVHPFHGKKESEQATKAIKEFCKEVFGQELEVTYEKHPRFSEIWDDKAVRVIRDTGVISDGTDIVDPLSMEGADSIGEFLG